MNRPVITARDAGLLRCHVCTLVSRAPAESAAPGCPRCGSALESRKAHSLSRTIAFLLAASVLYVPANLLPIMYSQTLLSDQDDTIFSGIIYLWRVGSYALAVIVFVASIAVPLLKIFVLGLLVWSVKHGVVESIGARTRLYRVVDFIGRWSMLDVYVLGILTALVRAPGLARVTPGPAAVAFAAVVVLTLLAARSFDPRLMWDVAGADVAASVTDVPDRLSALPEVDR